jgi:hypothetical protein
MKPAVLWIFQFAFGCHHSQMSRVFTIKKRSYQVCCDCGDEFDYAWTPAQPGLPRVPATTYAPPDVVGQARILPV